MVSDAKILENYNQGLLTQPCGCTPGTPGCGWATGDMTTASQDDWGTSSSNAGALLTLNFNSLYPNDLIVGGNFTLTLTQSGAVFQFLPAIGTAGILTGGIVDPVTTSAGEFAGEVVALKLNVDFSVLLGNSAAFGDLVICNVTSAPTLNGNTVSQFLATANAILGGDSAALTASTATAVAWLLNEAFVNGAPSTFAQNNLRVGGCGWADGDMRTSTQSQWGDSTSGAATLLQSNFTSVFGSALVVGGTFFMAFTSAAAVINYLPAAGTASVLNVSVQNPLSTSSGELGGEVLALQINVDFSSVVGNAVSLGGLRFCNVTDLPSLNGQTVDEFLATANHLLGGGSAPFGPTVAAAVARRINGAFVDGTPSTFAQASLVAGACPAN